MDFPYEVDAYNGLPVPNELVTGSDIKYYVNLRNLYWMYREGQLSRDDATKEKKKITAAWEYDRSQDEAARMLGKLYQKLEAPFIAFRKDPTVENAKRLWERVYSMRW